MVFSSIYFLLYFLPILLVGYYLTPRRWKNLTLLLGSCYFYAWGEPTFIFIVLASLVLDFYLIQLMYYAEGKVKKILLTSVLVLNVGNLFVHKYLMFLVENLSWLVSSLGGDELYVGIILPIGISFITFQKVSYAVDVYRNTTEPQTRFVDYSLYILLFPQLIAGPIIRYHEVADQLRSRFSRESIDDKLLGMFRFMIGLSKKVLIANPIGGFVDEVFALHPPELSSGMAWLGMIAYTLQIYFDFSGYSDMAIGLARMLGFHFPENFNFPYISQSITEFWRRWHITLGTWMRDYLYIPLGGNRVPVRRLYFNLWVVFLLSGLWHGAAWNFVMFGAFHGAIMVLERRYLLEKMKQWPKVLRIALTFLLTMFGWVVFRQESLYEAMLYYKQLFAFHFQADYVYMDSEVLTLTLLGLLFSFAGGVRVVEKRVQQLYDSRSTILGYAIQTSLVLGLGYLCMGNLFSSGFNPFIYFRF